VERGQEALPFGTIGERHRAGSYILSDRQLKESAKKYRVISSN
jgi:hypothetical protein